MRYILLIILSTLLALSSMMLHARSGSVLRLSARYMSTGSSLTSISAPFLFSQIQKSRNRNLSVWQDADITRFVTKRIPLGDREYVPAGLVSISGSSIDEAWRSSMLRREARDALWDMAREFEWEFGTPLVVVSGYRSAKYQQRLWDLGRCTDTLCAPPGYSEHQLWLAVDIFDASTAQAYMRNPRYRQYVTWLSMHAHEYWYTQSYQKWESIDAYEVEPWHWRYLGVPLATKLHELGMTYSEYIELESILASR